jgi:hypothetical protein
MSTWHPPAKTSRQPTQQRNPNHQRPGPSDSASKTGPSDGGRKQVRSINANTHPGTTPRRANWHRLLGTLLSSQGTDAHPSGALDPFGGNRSNLAVRFCLVKLPVRRLVRGGSDPSPPRSAPAGEHARRPSWLGGRRSGGPATECDLGVRSSLPGDDENITQTPRRSPNPCAVTGVTACDLHFPAVPAMAGTTSRPRSGR